MRYTVEQDALIVVDEDNNWLHYTEELDIDKALEEAKHGKNYDPTARLYVYRIIEETEFQP